MNGSYVIIRQSDGVCTNRVLWDGISNWQPNPGYLAIFDNDGVVQINDTLPDVNDLNSVIRYNPPLTRDQELQIFQGILNQGYTDSSTGIKLKADQTSINWFTSQITALKEGIDLGAITNDTIQSVWDYDDVEHKLTVLEIRQLLFRFSIYITQIFAQYAP